MLPSFVRKIYRPRACALTVAGLFVVLSALLTACPGLPPPEVVDFENDPSILRGAWTGEVGEMVSGNIFSLASNPEGQRLAVAASYGGFYSVFLYDDVTLEPAGLLSLEESEYVYYTAFGSDGSTLATSGTNVSFWNTLTRERLRTLTKVQDVRAFSRDLTMGVALEQSAPQEVIKVKVWDLATETVINVFEVTAGAVSDVRGVYVNSVALSPDGTMVAVADSIDKLNGRYISTLRLWNVKTGDLEKTFVPQTRSCPGIGSVAFSPDGRKLAFTECDSAFSLVDVASGRRLPVSDVIRVAQDFAFSPDGSRLVTGREKDDVTTFNLWNLDSESLMGVFERQNVRSSGGALAFSADGARLATGNMNGTVSVWDVSSLKRLTTLPELTPFRVSLMLEASYVDERSYTVEGTLTTEAGDVYKLVGTADGGTAHRYIRPASVSAMPQHSRRTFSMLIARFSGKYSLVHYATATHTAAQLRA